MDVNRFSSDRAEDWNRLRQLIASASGRPQRLAADELRELASLYRASVADLARIRHVAPSDPHTVALSGLVVGARQLVYNAEQTQRRPIHFFTTTYWQLIRERPVILLISLALLLVPAVVIGIWSQSDPGGALGLVPFQFADVLDVGPGGTDQGMSGGEQAQFSAFLIANNVQVAIFSFALGLFFAIGAAYIVFTNALTLGAVGGLLVYQGDADFLIELVAAHGGIELSAIVISAAAGMRMGWALVDPGYRTRKDAVVEEAKSSVLIAVGTIPWIVIAGLIEAFVSRSGFSAGPMLAIGFATASLYWGLIFWRGRPDPMPVPAERRGLLTAPSV